MLMRDSNLLVRHDRKLAMSFGAVVLMLMLMTSGITSYLSMQLSQKQEDRLFGAVAAILSESISRVSFSGKYHARIFIEELRSRIPDLAFISVETKDGLIMAHSDPAQNDVYSTNTKDEDKRLQSLAQGTLVTDEHIHDGITFKEVVIPYRGGIGNEIIGVVRLGIKSDDVRKQQRTDLLILLVLITVLTALAIWGVLILSHHFGSTVRNLAMQLQGILNHAPLAIGISDRTGHIHAFSVKYEDLFGSPETYRKQEQLFALVLPDAETRRLVNADREVFASGAPSELNMEVRIQGQKYAWNVSKFPIARDNEGKATLVCTFIHDVSEEKKKTEALRENERRLSNLMGNLPGMAYRCANDRNWTMEFVSAGCHDLLECSPEDIIGNNRTSYNEVIHPEDRKKVWDEVEAALSRKGQFIIEYRIRTLGGKDKWVWEQGCGVFTEDGTLLALEGFITDITERKLADEQKRALEEKLQRAEKMEAIGTMAGGVAHDLNNVLGVVVGYAELMLNSIDRSSPFWTRLENIMKGGERAAAIVQDLLTLARRGVAHIQVFNLNKLIEEGRQSPEYVNLTSRHPGIQFKIDLDPDLLNISGSPVHVTKTIFNLAVNAAESMPGGGLLTIATSNRYLDKPIQGYDDVRAGDYVVLSVSDTGEGIPQTDLKRIFEPFYTKKIMGRSGTGLGLAVVWGTVKDHHGYINVESEVGKGSTFILYFPVTTEKLSVESVAVAASEYRGKGETLLVVDDVKEQRELATAMLTMMNYRVRSVASGEEAIKYLQENEAELIVLYMIMDPGMDGLDTYRNILKNNPRQKAVIVSGFSESDRVKQAQILGAGPYIKKPYILERLGLAVRKELDR